MQATLTDLLDRVREPSTGGLRRIVGLTGPPGCGKSTLAQRLTDELDPSEAVLIGMDGFHLAEDQLRARGLQGLKGAPETFDRSGFVAMLHQLRSASDVVLAPVFDRTIGDPVAAAIAVPPQIRLVIIEGNYLLLWPEVRPLLDDIWYLDLAPEVRVSRLVARHVEFGKAPDEALAFVRASDEANAARIALDRASADLILDAD